MMNAGETFDLVLWSWLGLAVITSIVLLFVKAPYGRHARPGWGPNVNSRLGWVIMESPSPIIMGALFVTGGHFSDPARWCFVGLWLLHYVNRSWIYPFKARLDGKTMPLSIALMGFTFNGVNASLVGAYLFTHPVTYGPVWLTEPCFIIGLLIFATGMAINLQSDRILHRLRGPDETGYKIPYGGAYRWVSCPNYLGEIMEWTGFAILTWSMPAVAFAVWTIANLAPRARDHHGWYQEKFTDYPPERKAIIPGLF